MPKRNKNIDRIIQFPGISFRILGNRSGVEMTYRGENQEWVTVSINRQSAAKAIRLYRAKMRILCDAMNAV